MTSIHRPTDIRLPHTLLETAPTRSPQMIAAWRQGMSALYDVRPLHGDDQLFHCRAEAFHFGELVLTRYQSSAQSFDRSPARIARDGVDHITLQFCLSGRHGPRDGCAADMASGGDLLVADLAQRQATATSAFDSLNLTLPRRLLAPRLSTPDDHNLRRIQGGAPLVVLLRNHLIGLLEAAPAMSGETAGAVVEPTVALAAAVLNAAAPAGTDTALDPVRLALIRRFVTEEAVRPDLSAEDVAVRFNISRRKLYYLLAADGGFHSFVREQRLRKAQSLLRDPAERGRSIADIAEQCGFSWRTNFARTFRTRFGMTPKETRVLSMQTSAVLPAEAEGRDMWDWIRTLR